MANSLARILNLSGGRVLIMGVGRSGLAATRLALSIPANSVTAVDTENTANLQERKVTLENEGAEVILGGCPQVLKHDIAVVSPGIAPTSDFFQAVRDNGIPIISELEFAFCNCPWPLLAVTGTNGKTTTVEMVAHCLQWGTDLRVTAGGNIGVPLSEIILASELLDYVVLEVSSYQLEHIVNFCPHSAALLNVEADHMDRYSSLGEYASAKLRLFENLDSADNVIVNSALKSDDSLRRVLKEKTGSPVRFSSADDFDCEFHLSMEGWLTHREKNGNSRRLIHESDLAVTGRHNVENALAALALCSRAGADPVQLANTLPFFKGGRHRFEEVVKNNEIIVVNDSKATNPEAQSCALRNVAACYPERQILLLAGGLDKNLDCSVVQPLLKEYVRKTFLFGSARKKMADSWEGAACCEVFNSFKEATETAIAEAHSGDVLLLSPGCASQDMFKSYQERGEQFVELIKRRLNDGTGFKSEI